MELVCILALFVATDAVMIMSMRLKANREVEVKPDLGYMHAQEDTQATLTI